MKHSVNMQGRFVRLKKITGDLTIHNDAYIGKSRYDLMSGSSFRIALPEHYFSTSTVESFEQVAENTYNITTLNSVYQVEVIPLDIFSDYKHHSGRIYVLTDIANVYSDNEEKFPLLAVYQSKEDRKVWSRPVKDFISNFTQVSE